MDWWEIVKEGLKLVIPPIFKRAWSRLSTWWANRRKRRTFQAALDRILGDYLKVLRDEHNWLRLVELLSGEEARLKTHLAQIPAPLEKVYVPLSTTVPAEPPGPRRRKGSTGVRPDAILVQERIERRVTIEELLPTQRALTVTGGPGSGKTTLLGHLALCYACSLRPDEGEDPVRQILGLPDDTGLFPIFLPLRQYGFFLKGKRAEVGEERPEASDLLSFATHYYAERVSGISREFFEAHRETGCLFLLDGMDEVSPDIRQEVRQEILALRRSLESGRGSLAPHRIIVTARPAAVAGEEALDRFHQAAVRDFDRDDQRRLVEALYTHMNISGGRPARQEADPVSLAEGFMSLVHEGPHAAHLRSMAKVPLLLTMMAVLYHEEEEEAFTDLPRLFKVATDRILRKWNPDDQPRVLRPLELTNAIRLNREQVLNDLHRPLGVFFLDRHEESVNRESFLAKISDLIRGLGYPEQDARDAATVLVNQYVEERAGLIVWRGLNDYGFLHAQFRDYLAATDFQRRVETGRLDADSLIAQILPRLSRDHWIQMAIPMLIQLLDDSGGQQREAASRLVSAILAQPDVAGRRGQNLLLGGRAFLEAQFAKDEPGWHLSIRDRLLSGLTDLDIPARRRARLGSLLAEYGDSRREVTEIETDAIRWVDVPEGACWIGSEAEGAYDDERPQAYVPFPPFRIMQYPVTQAQYAEFVGATRQPAPTSGGRPESSWRSGRPPRGKENHPVVMVSFADAVAFCEWLSGQLGFEVRLPTEGEWEYAAKGPQPKEERERAYPWEGPFDPEKCNTWESGIQCTSPVGIFPDGKSPTGVHEMVGNVWEWTASVYREYAYRREDDDGWETRHSDPETVRAIRGGSWRLPQVFARCAYRFDAPPGCPQRPPRVPVLLPEFRGS